MHYAFCVQASSSAGLGHLMRCLALAQALDSLEFHVSFLLDNETQRFARQRHDWVGSVVPIEEPYSQYEVLSKLTTLEGDIDWVVVDGYQFSQQFCKALQDNGYRVALFDDNVHPQPFVADAVINPVAEPVSDQTLIYGDDYRLLRRDFNVVLPTPVSTRQSLTINFGGSDPYNFTLPVLVELASLQFEGAVRVISGAAYPHLSELTEYIQQTTLNVQHVHNAQDMADFWVNARLAISAAGGSQFELAVCQTPAILVVVAENQRLATESAVNKKGCVACYALDSDSKAHAVSDIVAKAVALWHDDTTLSAMQSQLVGQADALGAERVIQRLQALLL